MTLHLNERRILLRKALSSGDTADLASVARALGGASEEDRAQLAKGLSFSRLMRDEGPTPRICHVLVALANPRRAAETLAPGDMQRKRQFGDLLAGMAPIVLQAVATRDACWRAEFAEFLAQQYWWSEDLVWTVCHTLVRQAGMVPDSMAYLDCFVHRVTAAGGDGRPGDLHGQRMARYLGEHADLLEQEFWALFRVEGMGMNYQLVDYAATAWDAAVRVLCQADPDFRNRLLAASLDALLRDFPGKAITWYLRVHRLAAASPQEVADRQQAYCAVLGTAPGTAVGLAQEMLGSAVAHLDAQGLIEASRGVLMRSEKKLIKAQLALLAQVAADAAQKRHISQIVSEALAGMPPDLALQARRLVLASGRERAVAPASRTVVPAVVVPPPRRTPLPGGWVLPPVRDRQELYALIAAQLDGSGQGTDLQRIMVHLASHPDTALSDALRRRAGEVIESVGDEREASPRRLLATVLLGRDASRFRGYARFVVVDPGAPAPGGMDPQRHAFAGHRPRQEPWSSRYGYQYLETHSPLALLADALWHLGRARRQGVPWRPPVALPGRRQAWTRQVMLPGEGMFVRELEVLGEGAKPFWTVVGASAVDRRHAGLEELALDVACVPAEFTFRAQEARDQDGYDQIVQWTAWLLQAHPDTLAAHFHPLLCAAVAVANVRGMGPLLAALGASRKVPGGPVYSALALAGSARLAVQRARAAEAIAQLAGAGLLDPEPFSTQIAAHIAQGFVMGGRLALTLADAASISALCGYRVLQTLERLLGHFAGVDGRPLNRAGDLVALAARLSADYGMPLPVPAVLLARRKGASTLSVAVRALETVLPRNTALVQEAALAAQRALRSPARKNA